MYPLKFEPILKSTIWGGTKIISLKHLDSRQQHVGESWEISEVDGSISIVSNGKDKGKSLSQMMQEYQHLLVGKDNYARFNGKFPLLIKFIDACKDLSIQVHPNDKLAMQRHHSMGKTEMWYVMDNNHGKAHLSLGLKKPITPQEYNDIINKNNICEYLANYRINPGDVFFIPSGRIHSIGTGCFIAEIQQTSDITYRIYDFGRKNEEGNPRELHTEWAKNAIDYNVSKDYQTHYIPKRNESVELISCPYFTTSLYDLNEDMYIDYSDLDSFVIYICVEGSCTIVDNLENKISLDAGETILLPATTDSIYILPENKVKLLEAFV